MSMTVLSVAYPFAPVRSDVAGGAEQVLGQLDAALVRAGHRSIVIACEGSRPSGELIEVPRAGGPLEADKITLVQERCHHVICDALQRYDVDLVHLHGIDFHAYLPPPGVPALATLHLPLHWYPAEALRPRRPDTWVHCVSPSQHAACPSGDRVLPPIENGVPVHEFASLHAKRNFVLMLARICPEKGVHVAIDAAKQADVPLLIAGEVFPYPQHQRYFGDEVLPRLDRWRRFIGPVAPARKRRLLGAARCVVIPSLVGETSSLVAREALASGTPVVAFDRGALSETVENGKTGFLVDDENGLSDAIGRTGAIDPELCRKTARERFPLERMIDRYFSTYAMLTRGKRGRNRADAA
jgi:glycosyltransferase involved in cell wall biosynthesis